MNRFAIFSLLFAGWLIIFSVSGVKAQNAEQETDDAQIDRPARPNLLRELDLSPDQIQRIRQFNKERRAVTQESQRRLKAANQALDEAIYSNASEAEIQARQKEMQAAHADFVKNRTINEQFVRQVLTAQQFEKFRNLQAQYRQQKRENNLNKNQGNGLNKNQNIKSGQSPSDKSLTPRQQRQMRRIEKQQTRRQNP
ncbi:MAG: Spy/CpxP family protein refolding chaperone [Pyrinomonadaceae bacterium]